LLALVRVNQKYDFIMTHATLLMDKHQPSVAVLLLLSAGKAR
jgi:hypothetical protein